MLTGILQQLCNASVTKGGFESLSGQGTWHGAAKEFSSDLMIAAAALEAAGAAGVGWNGIVQLISNSKLAATELCFFQQF